RRAGDARVARAHGEQVREVAARAPFSLTHLDPPLRGDQRRVDVVHALLRLAPEGAVEDGDGEQPRVELREPAVDLDLQALYVRAAELEREPAELRRERQERTEHLEVVRAD